KRRAQPRCQRRSACLATTDRAAARPRRRRRPSPHEGSWLSFPSRQFTSQLFRTVLAKYPNERTISLLAISVSNFEKHSVLQLELPLGLEHEERRSATKKGMARSAVVTY